jgi:hypothetical protein
MEHMGSSGTPTTKLRIGEQLIGEGLINQLQLEEALEEQERTGCKIVATLISLGHIDQATFLDFLSRQPGIASIDLSGYDIPIQLRDLVPSAFARQHEIIPMDKMGPLLTVGMACPLDEKVIEELETTTGMRVRALLVAHEAIHSVLDKYYPVQEEEESEPAVLEKLSPATSPDEDALKHVTATLAFEGVMTLVRALSSLPAMPDTVHRV